MPAVAGSAGGMAPRGVDDAAIRPIEPEERPAVLALNNDHATELSWLDPRRLAALLDQALYSRCIGTRSNGSLDAFLIALDQAAAYDSPNFLWFRERYPRFVYVDRLVVAPAVRGRGLARRLYADLFEAAERAGHDRVTCEVNAEPPNPASDALHAAMGFAEVGGAAIHGGAKTVRYFSREIAPIGR